MDIEAFLKTSAQDVEAVLGEILASWVDAPPALIEAMRYSLLAGGKRLRPTLVLESARMVGGEKSVISAMPVACALEMIHTYSLVHDDLPAMDDDDLRRGKPTLHKIYGEATAILVGDGLLTMAFDIAAVSENIAVIREIAQAAGVSGMVGGQFIDLASEAQDLQLSELQHLHRCKTGALITVSLRCGALLAGADEAQLKALTEYGKNIGLAFQITDDILDVIGDETMIGKPIGSDEGNEKSTYVALMGLDKARALAEEMTQRAVEALAVFDSEANTLRALAQYIVERKR